jgi:hypothetical protein
VSQRIYPSRLARAATLTAFARLFDGGSVRLFAGRAPASVEQPAPLDDWLAELRFQRPAFWPPVDDAVLAVRLSSGVARASGVLRWGRCYTLEGAAICDVSVGGVGSGMAIETDADEVRAGAAISVVSFALDYTS